jgi:hypothetical protein
VPFLKLGQADRERLGAPEAISIDLGGITNREAIRLRVLGYNTPRLWRNALRGRPMDEAGKAVAREVDAVDEDGNPAKVPNPAAVDAEMDYQAWTALVWLALRRAGIESDPDTLEFDLDELKYEPDPVPVADPGKAEDQSEDLKPSTS